MCFSDPVSKHFRFPSVITCRSSAFLAGPPNLWSMGNKYWPQHGTPNDRQKLAPLPQTIAAEALAPRPNTQVSQPFKHDVDAEAPVVSKTYSYNGLQFIIYQQQTVRFPPHQPTTL